MVSACTVLFKPFPVLNVPHTPHMTFAPTSRRGDAYWDNVYSFSGAPRQALPYLPQASPLPAPRT